MHDAEWGYFSIGHIVNILYDRMMDIHKDGGNFIYFDFMSSIFGELEYEIPDHKEYVQLMFKEKETNVVGNDGNILPLDQLRCNYFKISQE